MGKITNNILCFFLLCCFSCNIKKDNSDSDDSPIASVDAIVKEYVINYRSLNDADRNIYFKVDLKNLPTYDSLLIFSIYISSRPLEIRQMPFRYKYFEVGAFDNVALYYSDEKTASEELKKELMERDLILQLGKDGRMPPLDIDMAGGWDSWHCIMCKSDHTKYKIIESHYTFSADDIPKDFQCP